MSKITLNLSQLPIKPEEFVAGYNAYVEAREAHKKTEGVPAPWPDQEIWRTMYETHVDQIEIVDDTPKPTPVKLIFPPGVDNPRE